MSAGTVFWRAPAVALLLLALGLAACARSGVSAPQPTPTVHVRPTASPTATPPAAIPTAALSEATASPGLCPDPYPQGAPYEAVPGQTIHLRPTGTPPPLVRYEAPPLVTDVPLGWIIGSVLGNDIGHVSLVVKRLDNNKGFVLDGSRVFYGASLYKVWAMLEAFHQRAAGLLDFNEQYIVSNYYAALSLNEGELALCSEVTIDEALQHMMSVSDNIAGNIVLERDGFANVNNMLRTLGLAGSAVASSGDVLTSAADMARLVEAVARRQAVSPAASDEMVTLLESELIDDRLPALLPAGTRVAHKTGNWDNATHDAGIVYSPRATYVIVVLTDYGFGDDGAERIAGLSRAVYDYFNPR